MKKIKQWIIHNQLLTFFALSYLITWGFLLTLGKIYFDTNNAFAAAFAGWGVFGPAVAGILITGVVHPEKQTGGQNARMLSFGLGLLTSICVFSLLILTTSKQQLSTEIILPLFAVSLPASIPPAFVIASVYSRNKAVRSYLASLFQPRGAGIYYLIALTGPLIAGWLGEVVADLMSITVYWRPPPFRITNDLSVLIVTFLSQFFFANALGEEVGWRGFALPRLQARLSPLVASLVLGLFWFPWHLPIRWINPDILPLLFYGLGFIPTTIFLTWIYNRTQGSILAAGLAHVAVNLSGKMFFSLSNAGLIVQLVFAAVLVLMDRMWRSLPDVPSNP